jgi:hypothetical protein
MTCLQYLDASNPSDNRTRVVIMGTSIDHATSNPLSWSWLVNAFPKISFLLAVSPPRDGNHSGVPTFSVRTTTDDVLWCVYDVDLLAALYQPLPHEQTILVRPACIRVDLGSYPAGVIEAHKVFIIEQLASLRWRTFHSGQGGSPVIGWENVIRRNTFIIGS